MGRTEYRILLVSSDDEETALFLKHMEQLRDRLSFDVTCTPRLDEAVAQASSDRFHLIVIDMSLPDGKRSTALVKLRRLAASIPTMVMVSPEDISLAVEAERNGVQDHLVKGTWDEKDLERAINHSIERYRLLGELHRARDDTKECEQKFRAFFETTPDLVYLMDINLEFTDVNPAMAESFNMDAKELIGYTAEQLFGARAARQIERWDRRVLEGECIEQEHTRLVNGVPMTFLDMRVPLRNAEKEITGLCCISRNITERRKHASVVLEDEVQYPSDAMNSVMQQAAKIAATDGTVFLVGESGTGKDYLARWIHDHSERSSSPYFALNCAALSRELAESELFGHEPGAFTGARGRKRGMLELAEGGSLLLKEIGELPLSLQSKLLTFLDTRSFLRVGGVKTVTVDARLMAATHRNIEEEVANRRFLDPLYHRLNVFSLRLPPLRERIEDLPLLVESLIQELADRMQLTTLPVVDSRLVQGLAAHNWPGNIRELKNMLERALMLWNGGTLDLKLRSDTPAGDKWTNDVPFPSSWTLRRVTDEVTKRMCLQALQRTQGNKKEAARLLGTSRDALYRYIRRFKIETDLLH